MHEEVPKKIKNIYIYYKHRNLFQEKISPMHIAGEKVSANFFAQPNFNTLKVFHTEILYVFNQLL